jgi:hypothetical protein
MVYGLPSVLTVNNPAKKYPEFINLKDHYCVHKYLPWVILQVSLIQFTFSYFIPSIKLSRIRNAEESVQLTTTVI